MTFADLLFHKPFVPPPVLQTRRHLQDGYEETEKYRPSPSVQRRIDQRMLKLAEVENKILEFVVQNPASTREQIASGIRIAPSRLAERLKEMVTRGSLEREGHCKSRRGGPKTYFYWASRLGWTQ